MANCTKCNTLLGEGDAFCPECGAKVEAIIQPPRATQPSPPQSEAVICSNCGRQTSIAFVFCQECGAPVSSGNFSDESFYAENIPTYDPDTFAISDNSNDSDAAPKWKNRKFLPIMIAAGALAVVVAVTAILNPFKSSVDTPLVYAKGKNITITLPNNLAPVQLTEKIYDGPNSAEYSYLSFLLQYSKNGRYMVYADRINPDIYSMTLYHRDLKSNDPSLKIDNDILAQRYMLSADGKKVIYLKGEEGTLYLHNLKDKEKIDSGVNAFYCDENINKVVYEREGTLYIKDIKGKKEREKIASNAELVWYSKDLSKIYYLKDDVLYLKSGKKDSKEIASDIARVISNYDDGSLYYYKESITEIALSDYVTDDMKDSDAQFAQPTLEDFVYPDPDPYWAERGITTTDYNAYYDAVTLYREKLIRDGFRRLLAELKIGKHNLSLYYYDGSKESFIAENVVSLHEMSHKKPIIVYGKSATAEIQKINLSELTNIEEVYNLTHHTSSSELYIAFKDKESVIQREGSAFHRFNNSETKLYFVNNPESTPKLMEVDLSGNEASTPVEIDSDVDTFYFKSESDQLYYFKNLRVSTCDLYEDGELRASDVYMTSVKHVPGSTDLIYLSDYSPKSDSGTLNILKSSKSVKISDDVHSFHAISSNCIIYLKDYNINRSKGDLFMSKGSSKSIKVDTDVVQIIDSLPQDNQSLLWFPKS